MEGHAPGSPRAAFISFHWCFVHRNPALVRPGGMLIRSFAVTTSIRSSSPQRKPMAVSPCLDEQSWDSERCLGAEMLSRKDFSVPHLLLGCDIP